MLRSRWPVAFQSSLLLIAIYLRVCRFRRKELGGVPLTLAMSVSGFEGLMRIHCDIHRQSEACAGQLNARAVWIAFSGVHSAPTTAVIFGAPLRSAGSPPFRGSCSSPPSKIRLTMLDCSIFLRFSEWNLT